ncbi:MAG: glycosyltransferase 87 family protein [Sedimentisphaerales bacterium]
MREDISQPSRPGKWFWAAIAIGAIIRAYLVLFTQGTYDVGIWWEHAIGVRNLGLIGYYHADSSMNHPPFISVVMSLLLSAAKASGIPFRILLRAPFAILDAGTALLLLNLLRNKRYRFAAVACYWLHPLAIIFSSYHGNTDSAVAFFLLLCVWLLSKEKIIWAGVVLGASFWVKLPGILVIPVFILFVQGWRRRLIFLCAVAVIAVSTYLPALCQDASVVYKNVLAYRGQRVYTTEGVTVWGISGVIEQSGVTFPKWHDTTQAIAQFYLRHNTWFYAVPLALIILLRRSKRTVEDLGATVAQVYVALYGFLNFFSFQYFAWSVPFWFFTPLWFVVPATVLAGGYVYLLYWFVCDNALLLGPWDFMGHPHWPELLIVFKNLAILFFFISGCVFLIAAIYRQIVHADSPAGSG